MEFFYPDNFVRVFNDEEKDEVGEYEILVNSPLAPPVGPINNYDQSFQYNDDEYVDPENLTRGKDNNNTPDYLPNFISNFPNNLMQTFPINLATSFIPMGQFGGQNAAPMGPPPAYIPAKTDAKVKSLGQVGPDDSQGFGPGGGPGFGPGVGPGFGPGYGAGGGPGAKAVSGGSLRPCLYKFTYIWQRNGRSYWAYITRIDARSVSGWRWLGWRWVFFGVDTRRIDSFVCY